MSDYLTRTKNGTSFSGSDVHIFQACSLALALRMYARAKLVPNKFWTASKMLKAAAEYTGKSYQRGQYEAAASDLLDYAEALKLAPREDER